MTEPQKDTIYIDVDDEITNIIEKVRSSDHKIVALVLPKRATVLQSVVNMKLLKRSADRAKKNLVLITSESGLLPLAGAIGLHVAKNLQSKPAIPKGPDPEDEIPEALVHDEELETDDEPEIDNQKSLAELSGVPAAAATEPEETIDVDNGEAPVNATAAGKAGKKAKAKAKKDGKLKVPNFERFRKWLVLGAILLVVLLVGGYLAFVRLPKAEIVISTDSTTTTANLAFTANTTNVAFDAAAEVVPAQLATAKKTQTQTVPATGKKNAGNKASGSVSMAAKQCNSISTPGAVASGTGVSANGQTYITQQDVSFVFDSISGGCINFKASPVAIAAQNAGAAYNTGSASFTVAGRPEITASGNASGGTDNNVTVVSQSDIEAAKQKINTTADSDAAKTELNTTIQKAKLFAIPGSFTTDGPNITNSANVGDQVDNLTATAATNYTLLGVNKANLNTVINNQINAKLDRSTQGILNNGIDQATFTVVGKDSPKVTVTTSATIGPNLDVGAIKKAVAGKKKAETATIIQDRPSIKDVAVKYSPFWVSKTPGNPNKVTVTFKKAN